MEKQKKKLSDLFCPPPPLRISGHALADQIDGWMDQIMSEWMELWVGIWAGKWATIWAGIRAGIWAGIWTGESMSGWIDG